MENPTSPSNTAPPVPQNTSPTVPAASQPVTPTGAPYQPPTTQPTPPPIQPQPTPSKNKIPLILGIVLLLFIIGGAGFYVMTMNKQEEKPKNKYATTIKVPSPTMMPTDTPMASPAANASISADWKTYTEPGYSFDYPTNWYVNQYDTDNKNIVEVSDVSDSPNTIQGISENHIRIQVGVYPEKTMPNSFSYTNGTNKNDTIKPYTIGSLTGIKGEQESAAGLQEVVLLKNPMGGFASVILTPSNDQTTSETVFNQILSTLKFTK